MNKRLALKGMNKRLALTTMTYVVGNATFVSLGLQAMKVMHVINTPF